MRKLLVATLIVSGCSSSSDPARTKPKAEDRGPSFFTLSSEQVDAARSAATRNVSCAANEPKEYCAILRAMVDIGGILAQNAVATCTRDDAHASIECADTNAPAACASLADALEVYSRNHPDVTLDAFTRASADPEGVAEFGQRHDAEMGATLDMGMMLSHRCKTEPRVARAFTKLGFWGFDS